MFHISGLALSSFNTTKYITLSLRLPFIYISQTRMQSIQAGHGISETFSQAYCGGTTWSLLGRWLPEPLRRCANGRDPHSAGLISLRSLESLNITVVVAPLSCLHPIVLYLQNGRL